MRVRQRISKVHQLYDQVKSYDIRKVMEVMNMQENSLQDTVDTSTRLQYLHRYKDAQEIVRSSRTPMHVSPFHQCGCIVINTFNSM